jgi:hypothetical protein
MLDSRIDKEICLNQSPGHLHSIEYLKNGNITIALKVLIDQDFELVIYLVQVACHCITTNRGCE